MKLLYLKTKPTGFLKLLVIVLPLLLLSFISMAHTVTGYSANCNSNADYVITPSVTDVLSTSNYRWQIKNSSGTWVCLVNGDNTINGITINVSGAVSNLTTSPSAITITNPAATMNGLLIRCIISDGSGVNPCTMPSGNTYNSDNNSINHTINIAGTACSNCTGSVNSLNFNELSGGADITITNGATYTTAQLGSSYNLEAGFTGTVGSMVFTVTGPTSFTNTENVAPYNSPGTGSGAFTPASGTYTVNVKSYSGSDASGSLCNEITISFHITSANCTGSVNSLYFNELSGGADITITDGATYTTGQLGSSYNLEAGYTGTVGSMVFTVTGPTSYTNTENVAPYTSPSSSAGAFIPSAGTYTVNVKSYSGSSASGSLCNEFTITFHITSTNCSCPGNLLTNSSFEEGTIGWSSYGGDFYTNTYVPVCGSKHAEFKYTATSGDGAFYQLVSGIAVGSTVSLTAYAGVHDNSFNAYIAIAFLNSTGGVISVLNSSQIDNILPTMEQKTVSGVVPAGTVQVAVSGHTNGNFLKADQFCLTTNTASVCDPNDHTAANGTKFCAPAPICTAGNFSWSQPINSANGSPSAIRLISSSALTYSIPTSGFPAAFASSVTVNVTDVVSYDGYSGRNSVTQLNERWRIVFKKAGVQVGATPYTTDLPDQVNQGFWRGSLGSSILLPNGFDQIVLEHFDVANGSNGPGSVVPVSICISYTPTGTGSIGDRVWYDANGNGIQDVAETIGLTGVTVKLRNSAGTVIQTTSTDGSGFYEFTGLAAGTYKVEFPVALNGSIVTKQKQGTNTTLDSDPSQSTGITGEIVLASGQNITSVDAGYCPITLAVGNRVWIDANDDGIDNNGELGVGSATVKLYKDDNNNNVADGASIASTTTNSTGNYSFGNLAPGNYIIGVTLPTGYRKSTINGGDPDNNIDKDNNGINLVGSEVRGFAITLTGGGEPDGTNTNTDTNNTYDFGLVPTGTIGDRVWIDGNGNGLQDPDETAGLDNITVRLLTSTGTFIKSVQTSSTGAYLFTNLAPGSYIVEFPTTVTNYTLSPQKEGIDNDIDSDPATSDGRTNAVALAAGQQITTVDAGYSPTNLGLGDRVWYDQNNNGINDGENGIPGITVNLYADTDNDNEADGPSIATQVTNGTGDYKFNNLLPGNYIVGVVIPAGYESSAVDGGDPDNDIDADDNGIVLVGNEIRGLAITLAGGTENNGTVNTSNTNITYDFGLLPDCDCTLHAGNQLVNADFENGTANWEATNAVFTVIGNTVACGTHKASLTPSGSGIATVYQDVSVTAGATVSLNGFAGVNTAGLAGSPSLMLQFLNSSNVVIETESVSITKDAEVAHEQLDYYSISAVAPVGATKVRVIGSISTGILYLDALCLNISAVPVYSLGNHVWYDVNNDGTKQSDEPLIPSVIVRLYDQNGDYLNKQTVTNAAGLYSFTGLPAGMYQVGITTPAGYVKSTVGVTSISTDNQNDGTTIVGAEIRTDNFNLTANSTNIDFGLIGTAALGNFVWQDNNRNGIQETGEPGIPNVIVTLTLSNGKQLTTTTNANGIYGFQNLAPGTYSVKFTSPSTSFVASPSKQGTNGAVDSDPVGGTASNIVLAAGALNNDIDAGFYKVIRVSGNVWNDVNGMEDNLVNNSALTSTPVGRVIPTGLRVYLVNANTNKIVKTGLVAGNGTYFFNDVLAGNYTVVLSTKVAFAGQNSPFATLPSFWINTGETVGLAPGRDGVVNGKVSFTVNATDVPNVNFGIQYNNNDGGVN